jgi:hypothetical protein
MLARERAERLTRTDLEQHAVRLAEQRADAVRKADRLAQVSNPVLRITRLGLGEEAASMVRDDRDLRSTQLDAAQVAAELVEDGIEHA